MKKHWTKLVGSLVVLFMLLTGYVVLFDTIKIDGASVGVMESWGGGVDPNPLQPRTYIVPFWNHVYKYPVGVNVFEMSDKERVDDSYLVQSSDSQDMHLSLQTQWHIDMEHVVNLHRTAAHNGKEGIEQIVIRPILLTVVKNKATVKKALDAYSGEGLVKLQKEIEDELNNPEGDLARRGVIIDNFVIEHIKLDPEYTKEITARQVAIQREMRAVQEEKAAQADALKAKAVAQADLNKAVVEAERDKQVMVLSAEAQNEKAILAAEADAKKVVLEAQAKKDSGELEAAAILAIGKAKAEAATLEYAAYSSPGAEVFARIQIAESMGKSFSGIKGYLPEGMSVYLLGENFTKAVEQFVKPKVNNEAGKATN